MSEFVWRFPSNDSSETEGPNDGGISHFTSNRMANVIRESIQNSLDARADDSKSARVEIELTTLPPESFVSDSLQRSLSASIKSPHNDEAHKHQFSKGLKLLQRAQAEIDTLRITDSNTTGADDNLRLGGKPSKWESLTKSTGLSVKDQPDAAGSFGLGKHAPFAVTDIRTVLYSTAWQTNGQLHRRFQGKAILVSHEDDAGNKYRKTGYLGDNYAALSGDDIPLRFRLNEPGLALYLPGYEPESGWAEECIETVIHHFFHAILHSGLEVEVSGNVVDKDKINEYRISPRTADFIRVSKTTPVAETTIPDIGRVVFRLQVGGNQRRIALVRDAGMMITDVPRDMKIPGIVRLPAYWQTFTAIIECRSDGQQSSVLRESESPSHTSISTQQISDRSRRKRADDALKELGNWCREKIRELAEPQQSDVPKNAPGISRYLSINDEEENQRGILEGRNQEVAVTIPQQSNRAPSGNYARQGRRAAAQARGGGGDPEPGKKKGTGGKKSRRGTTPRNIPTAFTGMRFRPGTRRPTHSLVVTFDNSPATLRNIQLMAAVEDGEDVQVGISEAYEGNQKLATVKHNKITSLPSSKSDRRSIEFITQVPVNNKTYYLVHGGG